VTISQGWVPTPTFNGNSLWVPMGTHLGTQSAFDWLFGCSGYRATAITGQQRAFLHGNNNLMEIQSKLTYA
jgi:hypothetical protein